MTSLLFLGIVPTLNLKPLSKLNSSSADTIGSTFISDAETIISIPGVDVGIETGYEQMETVMTTTLPKEQEILQLAGKYYAQIERIPFAENHFGEIIS